MKDQIRIFGNKKIILSLSRNSSLRRSNSVEPENIENLLAADDDRTDHIAIYYGSRGFKKNNYILLKIIQ